MVSQLYWFVFHCRYYSEGNNWQIQERRIDTRDVSTFAGNKVFIAETDKSLYFHEHDKIELDDEKRIRFSEGKSILEQGPEEEEKVASTASMNDNDKGIPALGAVSDYKLKLVRCSNETNNDQMAELSASLSSHKCRVDDLLASINEGIIPCLHYMYKPYQHSCEIIAKRISKPYWYTKTR